MPWLSCQPVVEKNSRVPTLIFAEAVLHSDWSTPLRSGAPSYLVFVRPADRLERYALHRIWQQLMYRILQAGTATECQYTPGQAADYNRSCPLLSMLTAEGYTIWQRHAHELAGLRR